MTEDRARGSKRDVSNEKGQVSADCFALSFLLPRARIGIILGRQTGSPNQNNARQVCQSQ